MARFPWLLAAYLAAALPARADAPHIHSAAPPERFVASTEKPFARLMDEAMAIMDRDMAAAPASGDPDRDFVTMMMPHHQGAIDMAKALLVWGKDPELRILAQQIITEQANEIRQMQAWLARHKARPANPTERSP